MNKRTCLYEEHKKLNARFTEFGGWEMPVFYSSIMDEHNAVRNHAGIFDTSHMGEALVSGNGAVEFLEHVTTANIKSMITGQARYTFLLNEKGGVIDDLIIYKRKDDYLLIVNASNTEKDIEWLKKNAPANASVQKLDGLCLLALQGPDAQKILQPLLKEDLSTLKYFYSLTPSFNFINPGFAFLARTGYTGEDGFEILTKIEFAKELWQKLISSGAKPCGLGARDTLRLEASMPLHGHEIDENTTPLEAGLAWAIYWDNNFIGREALLKQKQSGLNKFILAFILDSGIPRSNCDIMLSGRKIGTTVSGTFSPTLKKGVGMGFANIKLEPGTKVDISIHGQPKPAQVVIRPFYKRKK